MLIQFNLEDSFKVVLYMYFISGKVTAHKHECLYMYFYFKGLIQSSDHKLLIV